MALLIFFFFLQKTIPLEQVNKCKKLLRDGDRILISRPFQRGIFHFSYIYFSYIYFSYLFFHIYLSYILYFSYIFFSPFLARSLSLYLVTKKKKRLDWHYLTSLATDSSSGINRTRMFRFMDSVPLTRLGMSSRSCISFPWGSWACPCCAICALSRFYSGRNETM